MAVEDMGLAVERRRPFKRAVGLHPERWQPAEVRSRQVAHTAPRLLMLDEPTRGIDVGAKAQIHKLIDEIAGSGVAVLMISSELPELIGISDRVYVMREGGLVAELKAGPELTQEHVVAYMV